MDNTERLVCQPHWAFSILMPSVAAFWKKAAECKCSPVVKSYCGFGLCGFFPTGTQNVKQERELLQHHLKGKGKRLPGGKSAASHLPAKEEGEKSPPCVFFLPSLNVQ